MNKSENILVWSNSFFKNVITQLLLLSAIMVMVFFCSGSKTPENQAVQAADFECYLY